MTTMLSNESGIRLAHPRVPMWLVNLGLALLLPALWGVNWLMQEYTDPYYLRIIVLVGINIILAVSLNLINGITGQFSLGHAGFMAIGAYTAGSIMRAWRPEGAMVPVALVSLLVLAGLTAA